MAKILHFGIFFPFKLLNFKLILANVILYFLLKIKNLL